MAHWFFEGAKIAQKSQKINFFLWPQKYDLEGKIEVVGQHWSEIYYFDQFN